MKLAIIKVIRIYPLRHRGYICKCHGNPSNSCWNTLVWTKVLFDWPTNWCYHPQRLLKPSNVIFLYDKILILKSKTCFISSSLLVTKSLVTMFLHHLYSLWPERDDINPKVNVPGRGAEEWVGVWVTHLDRFYASVKLNAPVSLISLCSIYQSASFTFFYCSHTFPLKSCPAMVSIPLFYWSRLPAASQFTPFYLASSSTYIRNHLRLMCRHGNKLYCYWTGHRSKTGENVWTLLKKCLLSHSSRKWSVGGYASANCLKACWNVTCEVRWPATSCHSLSICVIVFVCVSGAFARSSGFFWPTYCSRRSAPKKSMLISCLSGQPVCFH